MQQVGKLKVFFAGATVGLLIYGETGYSLYQEDDYSGVGDLQNMQGSATLASISGAALIGKYAYTMRLGNTFSTSEKYGTVQEDIQVGIDASADLFYGYSWISDLKNVCCKEPGSWH